MSQSSRFQFSDLNNEGMSTPNHVNVEQPSSQMSIISGVLSTDETTSTRRLSSSIASFLAPKQTRKRITQPDDVATVNERIISFIVPPNFRRLMLSNSKKKSFISEFGVRLEQIVTTETTTTNDDQESVIIEVKIIDEWFYCLCSSECTQKLNCKKNTSGASDHLRLCHGVEGDRTLNMRKKVAVVDGKLYVQSFSVVNKLNISFCITRWSINVGEQSLLSSKQRTSEVSHLGESKFYRKVYRVGFLE